jgi:hypothetical protein
VRREGKVRARISCRLSGAWAVDGWKSWPTHCWWVGLDDEETEKENGKCGREGGKIAGKEHAVRCATNLEYL